MIKITNYTFISLLILAITIIVMIPSPLSAASYRPLSMEHQLSQADAVVFGKYIGKSYRIVRDSEVVTEIYLELKGHGGGRKEDENYFAARPFKVLMPGGERHGVYHEVVGTPTFLDAEEVILVLAVESDGPWIKGLSQGKYSVEVIDGSRTIISSVFPNLEGVGRVTFNDFEKMVERRFGKQFKYIAKMSETDDGDVSNTMESSTKPEREIASIPSVSADPNTPLNDREERVDLTDIVPIILLMIVAVMVYMMTSGRGKGDE
ncbi:MAG: hypothetical protein HQK52_00105 [Oligoflexia bacterium]|nr:hypothetical protein [Oligoflexia bacterium]